MNTNTFDQIKFVILYYGVTKVDPIVINSQLLSGGSANTFAWEYVVKRPFSNLPLYDPVPLEFLKVASKSPSFHLTTNSLPILCRDCSYNFNSSLIATVNSAVLSSSSIIVSISNPQNISFTLNDIEIEL
jgi:hypothetical protein